eukprot:gb/GFBE01045907.1/.p1 GENE.gb/GFBE01045907.1/~~gb/GFBE01045907.1/.p1  ORF type:complete len:205 (+),score=20.30 gb/GFBE01045907.1/:1-615(+)
MSIAEWLKENGHFHIPWGIANPHWGYDTVGFQSECIRKGSIACCCNAGFKFEFDTRRCEEHGEEVEDPIPGSNYWKQWHHSLGSWGGMTYLDAAYECGTRHQYYCCKRGCEFDAETDMCGNCSDAHTKTAPVKIQIQKFQESHGKFAIPRVYLRPHVSDLWGPLTCGDPTGSAEICTVNGETNSHCCCPRGTEFDWDERQCIRK